MRQADDIGRFMGEDGNLLAYFDRKKNTLWISGVKESVPCQTDEEAWDKISLFEEELEK